MNTKKHLLRHIFRILWIGEQAIDMMIDFLMKLSIQMCKYIRLLITGKHCCFIRHICWMRYNHMDLTYLV